MRKLPTGEPCAGEPLARFGGRGGREPFPTPINLGLSTQPYFLAIALTAWLRRLSLSVMQQITECTHDPRAQSNLQRLRDMSSPVPLTLPIVVSVAACGRGLSVRSTWGVSC